ncbi:MAG: hypothetical protein RSC40_02115 [Clostridia bacterium]
MKKVYVFVAVVFIVLAAIIGYGLSFTYDRNSYISEFAKYINQAIVEDSFAVEYNGETHKLYSADADEVLRVLKRGKNDYQKADAAPEAYDEKLTIFMGDMTVNVYQENREIDAVVIERVLEGKKRCRLLNDYKTFEWLLQATGVKVIEQ